MTLRTVEEGEEDRAFCQRAFANPEIRVPIGNSVRSRSELDEVAETEDGDQFLVCLDSEGESPGSSDEGQTTRIGWVRIDESLRLSSANQNSESSGDVDDVSYRRPDLGFWLAPEFHSDGYGKEAVALAVEYTFATYDYPAVGAIAYEFTDASRGLLESLGFEEEGGYVGTASSTASTWIRFSTDCSGRRGRTATGWTDSRAVAIQAAVIAR